jgi:7,8-dihydropterin-6-yl-methyl-4-(beta-D-ribofuranosyl)aminobenzene 5'-phosphate synthase
MLPMQIKLTVLTDNMASYGYLAEWGLSLFVEAGHARLLYDCGFTDVAVRNADLMGINLRAAEAVVLSHGHLDHAGGLAQVLAQAGSKSIFAHPAALERKIRRSADSPEREIGLNLSRDQVQALGGRLEGVTAPKEIFPSILTSGEVPLTTAFEQVDDGLYHFGAEGIVPDPLLDDLSLAIKTGRGLIVLLGCAHRGPINIIRHFQQITGEERVYAVVGGLHLMKSSPERIAETTQALKDLKVKKLYCGHCTGFRAMAGMAREFGDDFAPLGTGLRLEF